MPRLKFSHEQHQRQLKVKYNNNSSSELLFSLEPLLPAPSNDATYDVYSLLNITMRNFNVLDFEGGITALYKQYVLPMLLKYVVLVSQYDNTNTRWLPYNSALTFAKLGLFEAFIDDLNKLCITESDNTSIADVYACLQSLRKELVAADIKQNKSRHLCLRFFMQYRHKNSISIVDELLDSLRIPSLHQFYVQIPYQEEVTIYDTTFSQFLYPDYSSTSLFKELAAVTEHKMLKFSRGSGLLSSVFFTLKKLYRELCGQRQRRLIKCNNNVESWDWQMLLCCELECGVLHDIEKYLRGQVALSPQIIIQRHVNLVDYVSAANVFINAGPWLLLQLRVQLKRALKPLSSTESSSGDFLHQ